ncbi:RraA family protein [Acinetobacter sp. C32I]|uniref:RraA family protein n=1 Tax=Acinetobacter sp. C32I TaxID=2950074 RepID=UPI0020372AB6|nr:RraA family protein [Acinetobacter sp. C32I]USA55380.1 RraA family protein [Acinetobacter sp. C32I]
METTLMSIKERLLALDTASVSDAMDSLDIPCGLHSIHARVSGKKIAGPAFTVKYESYQPENEIFSNAGNYIDTVIEGSVIVIDSQGRSDCTNWGNILTTKAKLNNIEGTVLFGAARDINEIRKMEYPLFSSHIYMVSGKNRTRIAAIQNTIEIGSVIITPGDWIFGDDNGVLSIPQSKLLDVLERAENVELTEQRILAAVLNGGNLSEARKMLGYATPWEVQK